MNWKIKIETAEQYNKVLSYFTDKFGALPHPKQTSALRHSIIAGVIDGIYGWSEEESYMPSTPLITWEEFEALPFTLPERWCIQITEENRGILSNWRSASRLSPRTSGYCLSENGDGVKGYYVIDKPRYPEITTEQFKKHILKEKDMKITGYKAPRNLYSGCSSIVREGELYKLYDRHGYRYNNDPVTYLPKEIVETWEAVYAEECRRIHIGIPSRKAVVYEDKIEVTAGNGAITTFSMEDIKLARSILESGFPPINGLSVNVASLRIGCEHGTEIRIGDLDQIKMK